MNALPPTCDCLIVGGGVIGMSIAYEAAARGHRVCVVDHQTPGRESSWAGVGMLPAGSWYTDHPLCEELARISMPLTKEWSVRLREETGIDNEYRECGGIFIAPDQAYREQVEARLERWKQRGIASQSLTADELAALEPALAEPLLQQAELQGAFYVPGEVQVRNPRHMAALIAGAKRHGAQVVYPLQVQRFLRDGDRLTVVETDQGRCQVGSVIIAAGAWSGHFGELLGVPLPMRPMRGQVVLFNLQGPQVLQRDIHLGGLYATPRLDGRVLIGTTLEDVGFDSSTTPEAIERLTHWGRTVAEPLRDAQVEQTWAGLRPASKDDLPYLGPLPGLANVYAATGHYRAGLQVATGTAVILADLLDGRPSPIPLDACRPGR